MAGFGADSDGVVGGKMGATITTDDGEWRGAVSNDFDDGGLDAR
jgi:hypothetical protein